jgi:hypothetical protein
MYEYKCSHCEHRETIYMSMEEYDNKKDSVICKNCYEEPGGADCNVRFMARIFSTSAPLVYNTFGSYLDKTAPRMPKEFFDNQLEQQRQANDAREREAVTKDPELKKRVNQHRKNMGADPL